eukprot:7291600-Pyramimonas_sp.AAC.1
MTGPLQGSRLSHWSLVRFADARLVRRRGRARLIGPWCGSLMHDWSVAGGGARPGAGRHPKPKQEGEASSPVKVPKKKLSMPAAPVGCVEVRPGKD